jgi:pyruvate dehydrogenase E1 component alpha subunit
MEIKKDTMLSLYRKMISIRAFEEKTSEMYAAGNIPGFVHLYLGEEAVASGVCENLTVEDYITSTHRGHGHLIGKGGDMKLMMAELYAKKTGYCKGKGGSMHICDLNLGILGSNGIVGAGLPIAVGAGYACKVKGKGQVAVCFFGDGASNRGTFHESINMASIWDLPVVYVCENNFYGISGSQRELMKVKHVSERAAGYGIPGVTVDGNDVLAVYEAAGEAIARAREGKGPTLLECITWRHHGHWEGDPDYKQHIYRDPEECCEWLKKDPIPRFEKYLLGNKIASQADIDKIINDVNEKLVEAVRFAEESPVPEVSSLLEDVYA